MAKRLVYGWGINDLDRPVMAYSTGTERRPSGKLKQTLTWMCPYYAKWLGVLQRSVDKVRGALHPTYINVMCCAEWQYLSKFIEWVDNQPNKNWVESELDKDFLSEGCKVYSPDTCVFITRQVNNFILSNEAQRGDLMIGVTLSNNKKKFRAQCCDPFIRKQVKLGTFDTELEAHLAWQAKKHEHACRLADMQQDDRVATKLRSMYNSGRCL